MDKKPAINKNPVISRDNVMGIVHPFKPQYQVKGKVEPGTTVYKAIHDACKAAKVRSRLVKNGIAQIGVRDFAKQVTRWEFVPYSQWKKRKLKEGELLRFRVLPKGGGGGGGGKDPLRTILTLVVVALAIAVSVGLQQWQLLAPLGKIGVGIIAGLGGAAVSTVGMALVNAIAPVSTPSVPSISARTQNKEADVYSISAGRNQIEQWGRVPAPVGRAVLLQKWPQVHIHVWTETINIFTSFSVLALAIWKYRVSR